MSQTPGSQRTNRSQLEQEARVFTRYLVRRPATDYVVARYADAHQAGPLQREPAGIERTLLAVAAKGRWGTALADAYAGLFARTGVTRSKLVVMFGILEASAPFHADLDQVPAGGWPRLVGLGLKASVVGVLAVLVFGPLHLIAGGQPPDA